MLLLRWSVETLVNFTIVIGKNSLLRDYCNKFPDAIGVLRFPLIAMTPSSVSILQFRPPVASAFLRLPILLHSMNNRLMNLLVVLGLLLPIDWICPNGSLPVIYLAGFTPFVGRVYSGQVVGVDQRGQFSHYFRFHYTFTILLLYF